MSLAAPKRLLQCGHLCTRTFSWTGAGAAGAAGAPLKYYKAGSPVGERVEVSAGAPAPASAYQC